MITTDHRKGCVWGSRDLFKFWEISDNISEMVKIETWLQWKTNRKSYGMWPIEWQHCQHCQCP